MCKGVFLVLNVKVLHWKIDDELGPAAGIDRLNFFTNNGPVFWKFIHYLKLEPCCWKKVWLSYRILEKPVDLLTIAAYV